MRYGYDNPPSAQLELTAECNNNCIHCYNYWRSSNAHLPVFAEKNIGKLISNLTSNRIFNLAITGGEPMLHPNLFISLLEQATSEGISCWVNSNLTLLTDDIAKKLYDYRVVVRTSLLSCVSSVHDRIVGRKGAFSETITGIKLLLEVNVPLHVNMVVMQQNCSQVLRTGEFLKAIGVKNFTATKVSPAISKNQYDKLKLNEKQVIAMLDALMLLKKKHENEIEIGTLTVVPACIVPEPEKYDGLLLTQPCIAGKTECAIAADGSVKPCVRDDTIYGNVAHENLSEIWRHWKIWEDGTLIPQQCRRCRYLAKCGGGCRMDCKCINDIHAVDPYAVHAGIFSISDSNL